jgi:hypothetical protein
MKKVICILTVCLMLAITGCFCESAKEKKARKTEEAKTYKTISGVLTDIDQAPRGKWYTVFLISFEDGRIVRLEGNYCRTLIFHKGKMNTITYNRSSRIESVVIEDEK